MTSITWPTALPRVMRIDGLSAKRKSVVIRTKMDAGPEKVRQRYTISTKEFSGSIIVTESQRQILESFYTYQLGNGTRRFVMQDPQTLNPAEFRFLSEYQEKAMDGLWEITMNLEELNA